MVVVSQGRAEEQLKWGGLGSIATIAGYAIGCVSGFLVAILAASGKMHDIC